MNRNLAAVLLICTLSLTACGTTTPVTVPDTTSSTQQEETTDAPEASEAPVEEEAPEEAATDALHALNEECTLNDWSITASKMEIMDKIDSGNFMSFTPEGGNKYLVIDLSFSNNGTSAQSFLPTFAMGDAISAKVIYQGSYEFTALNLLGYDKDIHDTTVNPLSSKNGVVAFEIPDKVADSEEELILDISAGSDELKIKLR